MRVAHPVHLRRLEACGVRRAGVEPPGGRDTTAAGKCQSAVRSPRGRGRGPRPPRPGGAAPGSHLKDEGPGTEQSKLPAPSSRDPGVPAPISLHSQTPHTSPQPPPASDSGAGSPARPPRDPGVPAPSPLLPQAQESGLGPSPVFSTRSTTMIVLTLSPRLRRWGARGVAGAG